MDMKLIKLIPFDVCLHNYAHSSVMIIVTELLKYGVSFCKRKSSNSKTHQE